MAILLVLVEPVCSLYSLFFFNKNVVFPAQAEYSFLPILG